MVFKRLLYLTELQKWQPFPKRWYNEGLITTERIKANKENVRLLKWKVPLITSVENNLTLIVPVNSQLLRHVEIREAVLGPNLCLKKIFI